MLSINTNLSSLIAQNSLKSSSLKLDQAIERMTTGYKINHAKDNAANYSITTNMTTKIGAYQVAEDNALQGLEMMSTSLESLNQISDKLNRMRALAVQTQNGTYGTQSLNAISAEANALLDEITRINNSAEFNGIKLFNTGKADVTNAGKELELNEQGFLQDVVRVDTTHMTKLSSIDPAATLAVGEYSISTPEELAQLATMTNAGLVEAGSTFTLAANIDLSGYANWTPIGKDTNVFQGNFNGNGYSVSNLTCKDWGWTPSGLFGETLDSEISNIKIVNAKSTGGQYCGLLAGTTTNSTIANCSVFNSSIQGGWNTAGLVSDCDNIEYCYVAANIDGYSICGGIAATSSNTSNCVFIGNVKSGSTAGGILGSGNVSSSRSSGTVKATNEAGGIVGSDGHVISCYSDANVTATNNIAGGLVGISRRNDIFDSIFDGVVTSATKTGIFVGTRYDNTTKIENCYYNSDKQRGLEFGNNLEREPVNIVDIFVPTDYTLQIGSCGNNARSTLSYTTYIDFKELNNVLSSGIENAGTIEKIDELVNIVSMKQTELGTAVNRLESVLEEISIQYENLVSSRSTIRDADMAEVSSDYIRQQILQQASATLMSTANQSPAIALQLI